MPDTLALDRLWLRHAHASHALDAGAPISLVSSTLGHAHASHALDQGAPIHLVQQTLGHSSVATTGRYLHARPTDSSARYVGAQDTPSSHQDALCAARWARVVGKHHPPPRAPRSLEACDPAYPTTPHLGYRTDGRVRWVLAPGLGASSRARRGPPSPVGHTPLVCATQGGAAR